jgi:hypothetical protein
VRGWSRTQFPRPATLLARNVNRALKTALGIDGISIVLFQQQHALQPMNLCLKGTVFMLFGDSKRFVQRA